ncbi:hypothetical protein SALBM311S_13068 [Streptomyces alboniger]
MILSRCDSAGTHGSLVTVGQEDLSQVVLKLSVAELVDRAGLTQHLSLARIIQESNQPPGQFPGEWQP